MVSIHALLAECDRSPRTRQGTRFRFQSTHSLRSATKWAFNLVPIEDCFNPRTPCGVRRMNDLAAAVDSGFQSTHSLRSATKSDCGTYQEFCVSIHALLAECDRNKTMSNQKINLFQSTHSLRSATLASFGIKNVPHGFNPRTPCGVRLKRDRLAIVHDSFNPRTPCGVRRFIKIQPTIKQQFQSTHSLRSATRTPDSGRVHKLVSIHALLAECDIPWV